MLSTITVTVPSIQTLIVALRRGKGFKRVASGRNLARVMNRAHKQGAEEPIVAFVPKRNMSHIL